MRHLLESISNFSVADPKAPEVKEGEECDTCHKDPCECDDKDLAEALMQEYKYFVKEADPVAPPVAGQAPAGASPVAAVNPPGTGNPAVAGAPATNTATSQTGTAPKPGAPAAPPAAGTPPPKPPVAGQAPVAPAAGTPPPKPGAPVAPAPAGQAPKPGAPAAGTVTPPNPQQVKQQTDTLTKLLNNPAHPMNAELQALVKKAGSIPG
jgi:hypothetical protein